MKKENKKIKFEKKYLNIAIALLILLTFSTQAFAAEIIIEKENYRLSETVNIELKDLNGNEELQIFSESGFFKFSGELKSKTSFRPREVGEYTLRLTSGATTLSEKQFIVSKTTAITTNNLKTDRKEYLLNEEVIITIENPNDENLQLNIIADESYKYLGKLNNEIKFTPNKLGKYTLELRKNFIAIATAEFEVKQTIKINRAEQNTQPNEQILQQNNSNITSVENTIDQTQIIDNKAEPQEESLQTPENREVESDDDNLISAQEPKKKLPFKLQSRNKIKSLFEEEINEITQKDMINKKYDVKIKPKYEGVKNIEFRNLKVDKDISFDFDEVEIRKEDLKNHMKNKNSLRSFFIDTGELNYTNGTITATAVGSELWKCRLWNKTRSVCDGSWEKIMNIVPGQDYEILIYPEDPGFVETGVASINTKKPIYHPLETAEIIIVILDTRGRLVSGAQVNLTITLPDLTTQTITTTSGQIIETSKGIYETNITTITQTGTYELYVTAFGNRVDSFMYTTFETKNFYEFDILRETPVTIDPWLGPFESKIRIEPYINTTTYDFTEILPSEFTIVDASGASIDTIGNNTFLTWSGLTQNSEVTYTAQTPLISPNLYLLGKSFITYFDGVNKIFTEARNWLLAIDPIVNIFLEDFESGWGCTTTGAPASGNDCGDTPWGDFDFCDDNTGDYLFCLSDDGQEGDHVTNAIQMVDWDTWSADRGICYTIDPRPYDEITFSGYQDAAGLDAGEFCRSWARDSNSFSTLYECVNNVPAGCESGDTAPEAADYDFFIRNLTAFPGINLSETSIRLCIGADMSATNDRCFWDRINITTTAFPPNVTNLTFPRNNTIINISKITFNFTVNDSKDPVIPNCTLWTNISGTWTENATIYNASKTTVNNITMEVVDGTYLWNIICTDAADLTDWYEANFTFTVDAKPPVKTIVNIDSDYTAPYASTNRNPFINVSLNKHASCRFSFSNETYAQMSDDFYCIGNNTKNANCTYQSTQLALGINNFYIACNSTSGFADNTTTNLLLSIDILCDSHADCSNGDYCDTNQDCTTDVITGYSCDGLAYTGLSRNNVCGDGSNVYCVNDTTYDFTGWYCTDSTTDCVYNNNGNSYDLGFALCALGPNDYKTCSANNEWGSLVDCAEQFDPANQIATTHTSGYCAYFASAQTCTNGTSGGCAGTPTDCGSYIYNETTQSCGSVLSDCDLGCGSVCDSSNSTVANIISNICYYDKSCSNACGWNQATEIAPDFCINDNDGGACTFASRTNPNTTDTCYWNPSCADSVGSGLSLGSVNNLRLDYCDYCNAVGNQSGQFSPSPNTSCASNCDNSGTIYYDSGLTPANRNDDCSIGVTTILTDTITLGDIWNGSGPAYCDSNECNLDCGTLVGTCNLGVCECSDQDAPIINPLTPINNTWSNNPPITFEYDVTDISSEIANCSLIINNSISLTNNTINQSIIPQTFLQLFVNGSYSWNIRCFDNSTNNNTNITETLLFGIDTTIPSVFSTNQSGTNFNVNQQICLAVDASDTYSGINQILAQIRVPNQPEENITLSDSTITTCDLANGNNIYSTIYTLTFSGIFNWTNTIAIDNAGNINNTATSRTWNVAQGGNLSVNLTQPNINLLLNESSAVNNYTQTCFASCNRGTINCHDVRLFPQIFSYQDNQWTDMNATTNLIPTNQSYYCGNISRLDNPTWWNLSWQKRKPIYITSSPNSNANRTNTSIVINITGLSANITNCTTQLRIIESNTNQETPFNLISGDNSNDCKIVFKANVTGNTSNENRYFAYYNNSAAPNPNYASIPANNYRIFSEDFEGTSWTRINTNNPATACAGGTGNFNGCLAFATDMDFAVTNATAFRFSGTRIMAWDQSTPFVADRGVFFNFSALNSCGGDACDDINVSGYISTSSTDAGEYAMIWARNSSGTNYSVIRQCVDATACEFSAADVLPTLSTHWTFFNRTLRNDLGMRLTNTMFLHIGFVGNAAADNGFFEDINITGIREQAPNITSATTGQTEEFIQSLQNITNCSFTFTITANESAGNNTHQIRCKVESTNSPTSFSTNFRNITINDKPTPNITVPLNGSWLSFLSILNSSSSFDSDGSITNRIFEYDDNADFSSPSTICNTALSNCTWNITIQNQCINNSLSCYLRLSLVDNNGLNNSNIIIVGFDTNGPITVLDLQRSFANITTNLASINATATDNEVGTISTIIFEYRQNISSGWNNICNNSTSPYTCTWNLTNLPDANTYELRAYANDTLQNFGNADVHTNITVDRTAPHITLQNPQQSVFTNHTTLSFQFLANDTTSNINSCSLTIDSTQTNISNTITEDTLTIFSYGILSEGAHNWNITCIDGQNNQNTSITRTVSIDTTGPTTTLDLPRSFANITGANVIVNASAVDLGVGTISQTIFEYRINNTENWNAICADSQGPVYNCSWNTIGLLDANSYQIRAWSNDTLENNGSFDIHTNITIDNNPPNITLVSPPNQTTDGDGSVIFSYLVNNEVSQITSCNLILQGAINQTQNAPINIGQSYSFTVNNMTNGIYNWTVNCTDATGFNAIANEGYRTLTIDIRFVLKVNVTTNNLTYEKGNQQGPIINATNNITGFYNNGIVDATTITDLILITNKTEEIPGWWNNSWEKRKAIYLSSKSINNMTNTRVVVNITGLAGSITSCTNEIRIVTTATRQNITSDILSGDDTNYCEVAFLASITALANNENNYFAYYNNSAASTPASANTSQIGYGIFFEDFENGYTNIATEDPTAGCAGGFGLFSNCSDNGNEYDFAATTGGIEISGIRKLVIEDWDTWLATAGLWQEFNTSNSCGGDQCDDISVSGYLASASLDGVGDFCRVWARNVTGNAASTIYECVGPDPACEFTDSDNTFPTVLGNYQFFSSNLSGELGITFEQMLAVHIGGDVGGTDEHCFYEDLNITGIRKQAPNVTNAYVGFEQKWVNRKNNNTDSDGYTNSYFNTINKSFANYSVSTFSTKTNYTEAYNFTFIEIKSDFSAPIVSLNSPANMSESNSSVTFTYVVNDTLSSVLNCTLMIDFAPSTTSANPTEGPVQFFFPRIPAGGWHNWSVNCTDFYNNTGASEAWEIYIAPPDLFVNNSELKFNNTSPKEGENITINATMRNIGGSDAYNATLQFYLNDPDLGGVQIGENITISLLTDQSGNFSNITLNTTWIVTGPGPFNFFAIVDPPTATNGSMFELYETNNKANNTLNVPAYQYFYGNVTTSIFLGSQNNSIYYYLNITNVTGNIFVTGESNTLSFSSLQAIGRNVSNTTAINDFVELDASLNMSNFNDSNSIIYTGSTGTPYTTRNMSIFNKTIRHIPIINSTNSTNFITGILWDTNDGGNEYDGTQDIAYVTNINYRTPGRYGTYDYELKVPAPLENHKASTAISFYWEINT